MVHEVVVVGGGIGGLTVAALLAARGVDVCLLERSSQVGGVLARVESFGYTFDPGIGIYPCWEPGEIHDRIFSELPVAAPTVHRENTAYLVRLVDQLDVPVIADDTEFFSSLVATFPECAEDAINFYRQCADLVVNQPLKRDYASTQTAASYLTRTSTSFRQFIDAQLQLLTQRSSESCDFTRAAIALTVTRRGSFSIQGGAAALAERVADSIKQSGGRVRLNSPVLRLAYDSNGQAVGLDLLNGETVGATRAIISNLTVWDTFGKLIGLNRTPSDIRKTLSASRGWGAYVVYLGINEATADSLPVDRILAVRPKESDLESLLMMSAAPAWDSRAPIGKRALTVVTFTDVDQWFTFHESLEGLEEQDRSQLEAIWQHLHQAFPLGDDVEVLETSNPFTCYEETRRKLGMVGAPTSLWESVHHDGSTPLPNVHMVGDTATSGLGIAGVSAAAFRLANKITQKTK